MSKNITIFGREVIDEKAISQFENCVGPNDIGVLTADAHYGYGHPIGGAVAYRDHISVSGVGFDIACGNKAVKTDLTFDDIKLRLPKIMDQIYKRISFGVGRPNNEPVQHEIIDRIANANFAPQRKMVQAAQTQLGTVGSGNHFIDLFVDHENSVWIGVHFGSRGFGHKTATGFIALSQGLTFEDKGKEGSMDAPPILLNIFDYLGQDYIEAMRLAGDYAYAGRDCVVNKVLEIIEGKSLLEIHNHHNFAWMENHFGSTYWVVRKGCTPAFPGQLGFVGANMKDVSVIIEGVDSELSKQALYSTVHGAGRILSRKAATGKLKWMRDEHGVKRQTRLTKGLIDFDEIKKEMKYLNIELRGAGADEAPGCYKNLEEVLHYMGDTIKVKHRLLPIGVAMAGEDVFDPYKD